MFNLRWTEVALVIGVAILIFGPKKIPELGSALGKTLRDFKKEIGKAPEDPALDAALDAYDEAEDADVYR